MASTGCTDLSRLLDDISAARRTAENELDRKALDMLATWAINVAGEHVVRPGFVAGDI